MKPLDAYLPEDITTKVCQGNIETNLHKTVDKFRQSKGLTWNELLTALFERLVDEQKKKGA